VQKIIFVTSNLNKAKEVALILENFAIDVEHVNLRLTEIQSESLEEIAKASALEAADRVGKRVIVEDSGLFIKSLNGFPGPFSSYVQKTVGNKGILKLMRGIDDREASFKSAVGYYDGKRKTLSFTGEARGKISYKEKGKIWAFDPIFIPDQEGGKTYAQMGTVEKNKISHRRKALESFARWYLKL
jgi:XTP/dITP diphosphohydrolase